MTKLRKSLAALSICGVSAAGGIVGFQALSSVPAYAQRQPGQQAPAGQEPAAARQDLTAVERLSTTFRQVGERVEPTVVNITATKTLKVPAVRRGMPFENDNLRRFFREFGDEDSGFSVPETPDRSFDQIGTGSGVIVDVVNGTAYIVTNNHVVSNASDLKLTLNDGRTVTDAKVIGTDPNTDIAVLSAKVDNVQAATWGDSDRLQKGDWVLAFGSPFGYVGSMTHGIVSALGRQAGILGQYGYENFIQVDAPINPGNSGGPLVNMRGEIVGINTAIASQSGGFQGIGFAIPSNQAQRIYQTLREDGKIVRGWLGVQIADVSKLPEEAAAIGFKGDVGVIVKGVLRESPAIGQLEPGDVVVSLNGKKVGNVNELRNQIAQIAPGKTVTLSVVRNGKTQDVKVELGQQPGAGPVLARTGQPQEDADAPQAMGMRLTDVTPEAVRKFNIRAKEGALVTEVQPRSAAAAAGIEPGNVITRIGNDKVTSAQDVRRLLSKADLKQGVRLFVADADGTRYALLRQNQK